MTNPGAGPTRGCRPTGGRHPQTKRRPALISFRSSAAWLYPPRLNSVDEVEGRLDCPFTFREFSRPEPVVDSPQAGRDDTPVGESPSAIPGTPSRRHKVVLGIVHSAVGREAVGSAKKAGFQPASAAVDIPAVGSVEREASHREVPLHHLHTAVPKLVRVPRKLVHADGRQQRGDEVLRISPSGECEPRSRRMYLGRYRVTPEDSRACSGIWCRNFSVSILPENERPASCPMVQRLEHLIRIESDASAAQLPGFSAPSGSGRTDVVVRNALAHKSSKIASIFAGVCRGNYSSLPAIAACDWFRPSCIAMTPAH